MRNCLYFLFFISVLNCFLISNINGRPAIKEEGTSEVMEDNIPKTRPIRDRLRGQRDSATSPIVNKSNGNEIQIDNVITTPVREILTYMPTEENYYKIFKTFTNSNKNLTTIMKALAVYERNKNLGVGKGVVITETIENITEEEEGDSSEYAEAAKDKYAGNVYLKSILFISSNYWTIWVNDAKISSENNEGEKNEFFVKGISKDKITLVRKLSKGKWRYMNSGNYVSTDRYRVNEETNQVELTLILHPNQTFVIAKNEIIDGKLKNEVLRVDDIESIGGVNGVGNLSTPNEEINFDDLLNDL